MAYFEYLDAPFPVREDIKQAHRAYWQRLAGPGSWWTGAERLAIAAEARNARVCAFCKARKQALSPYTGQANHAVATPLPDRAVDAIHRVMTDQNRITHAYVQDNHANGLSEAAYVELTGIVVAMISIDDFHRGVGVPFEPLPEALDGEPDQYKPANLTRDTGFVPMLKREGVTGQEADLWGEGRAANVLRALSLVPNAVRDWMMLSGAQYLSMQGMGNFIKQEDRSINRMQMELIAGRVSSVNECFY